MLNIVVFTLQCLYKLLVLEGYVFFFFPSIKEKFLVCIGKKCFYNMKYKYSVMQGACFFCLND